MCSRNDFILERHGKIAKTICLSRLTYLSGTNDLRNASLSSLFPPLMMPPCPYVHQQTAPRQVCRSAAPHPSIGTADSEHCSNTDGKNEGGCIGVAATKPHSSFPRLPFAYLGIGIIV